MGAVGAVLGPPWEEHGGERLIAHHCAAKGLPITPADPASKGGTKLRVLCPVLAARGGNGAMDSGCSSSELVKALLIAL